MRVIYLLTRRGTLHKGTQIDGNHQPQVFEQCNLDSAIGLETYQEEMVARRTARRLCKRCWPGDVVRK